MPSHGVGKAGSLQGNPGIARFAALAAAIAGLLLVAVAQAHADTNRRTLTVTKSPSPASGTGAGMVSSKPKGINCGAVCEEAVAWFYPGSTVELTAKPAKEDSFVEWEGGDCDKDKSLTCAVEMGEDKEVVAVFSGPSKAIANPKALTLEKAGYGYGTVKAYGSLTCAYTCTETTDLYQGPNEEKGRPGKTVILKQYPAFGSEFTGWIGCDLEEEGNCVVTMETDLTVTAEFADLPDVDLTVEKSAYAGGAGSVSSMPKGIKCGAYCTKAVASMPEGVSVLLTAKPNKENVVEWEGGDCDEVKSLTCTVTMNEAEEITAVFKGPTKTINPAETLTLAKAGSGFGTVKGPGLGCEFLCTSTDVIYQGPITLSKAKPGKTVVLKAVSAPGSKAVKWTGCKSNPTPGECVVEMDKDHTVSATFDELE